MIDMNGKTITNLGSGQTPTDAVRKKYVKGFLQEVIQLICRKIRLKTF